MSGVEKALQYSFAIQELFALIVLKAKCQYEKELTEQFLETHFACLSTSVDVSALITLL